MPAAKMACAFFAAGVIYESSDSSDDSSSSVDEATAVAVNTAGIKKLLPVLKKAKIWDTSDDSSSSEDEATAAEDKSIAEVNNAGNKKVMHAPKKA